MTDEKLVFMPVMSFGEYAGLEGLNASSLKAGRASVKHMKHYRDHGIPDTPAMRMGRYIHSAILEPNTFLPSVVVWDSPKKSKAWDAFKLENAGKTILSPDELSALTNISVSVHSNPMAHDIIGRSDHEVSVCFDDHILGQMKARLDGYSHKRNIVLEIKSTSSVQPDVFKRTQYNMGTHIQLGWINTMFKRGGMPAPLFVVIGVEQKAPHDVVVFDVEDALIEHGEREAVEIAQKYRIAEATGIFSGVSSERMLLTLPAWAGGSTEEKDVSTGTMEASEL